MRILWKDEDGNCKCESCGKNVAEEKLKWNKNLGYCEECYRELKDYDISESQQSS